MLGQDDAPLQDTSQLHDAAQSIIGQASAPEQSIAHAFMPQLRLPHDAGPEHSTSQLCACAQSTAPHAPLFMHRIVQSYPEGHCTLPHGLPAVHWIRQVRSPTPHDVHCSGHSVWTQNPWSQNRPLLHS